LLRQVSEGMDNDSTFISFVKIRISHFYWLTVLDLDSRLTRSLSVNLRNTFTFIWTAVSEYKFLTWQISSHSKWISIVNFLLWQNWWRNVLWFFDLRGNQVELISVLFEISRFFEVVAMGQLFTLDRWTTWHY